MTSYVYSCIARLYRPRYRAISLPLILITRHGSLAEAPRDSWQNRSDERDSLRVRDSKFRIAASRRTRAGIGHGRPVRGNRNHRHHRAVRRCTGAAGHRADGVAGLPLPRPRAGHRDGRCRADRLPDRRTWRPDDGGAQRLRRRSHRCRQTPRPWDPDGACRLLYRRSGVQPGGGRRVGGAVAVAAPDLRHDYRQRRRHCGRVDLARSVRGLPSIPAQHANRSRSRVDRPRTSSGSSVRRCTTGRCCCSPTASSR